MAAGRRAATRGSCRASLRLFLAPCRPHPAGLWSQRWRVTRRDVRPTEHIGSDTCQTCRGLVGGVSGRVCVASFWFRCEDPRVSGLRFTHAETKAGRCANTVQHLDCRLLRGNAITSRGNRRRPPSWCGGRLWHSQSTSRESVSHWNVMTSRTFIT